MTMAADVPFLQPINKSIESYAMHGMSHDSPIPEYRTVASITWNVRWKRRGQFMKDSCMGLMSNRTALERMKVRLTCLLSVMAQHRAIPTLRLTDMQNGMLRQAYGADVMIAEAITPCSALLAHTLDLPWINHWPIAPAEPWSNAQWASSNRKLSQPNPLSYFPQFLSQGFGPATQYLVATPLQCTLQQSASQSQVLWRIR